MSRNVKLKTSSVMRLVNSNSDEILKNSKAETVSDKKPDNNIKKKFLAPVLSDINLKNRDCFKRSSLVEFQIVNINLMLINEHLGVVIKRFNVCGCDICCGTITEKTLKLLSPLFFCVKNKFDETEVDELLLKNRQEVIKALTKVCISARIKPFCNIL